MWPILPYDIISQIIDTIGEDKDTELLKELALVSHSFHHICCKHLFATVRLQDPVPFRRVAFKKESFVELLKSRPDVVKYIRKLTYEVSCYNDDDFRLSHILPKFLRTISRLNCLEISGSSLQWNSLQMDSSLTSALLYLMHLPTINHIDLSQIRDFPLSILTPSVNLLRLDIRDVEPLEKEIVMEKMPKIREFRTTSSPLLTTKLLHAINQDGQPVFNFMDLRRLSFCLGKGSEQNVRYLLQNTKLLEKLRLYTINPYQTFEGLHDTFPASAGSLKVLALSLALYGSYNSTIHPPFKGLCELLEAMTGRNMLESLTLEVKVYRYETADDIGSRIQSVEKILVNPGWPALRQVSFKVPVSCCAPRKSTELVGELVVKLRILLPNKYLSHLSKLDSFAFDFSSYVFRPRFCKIHL